MHMKLTVGAWTKSWSSDQRGKARSCRIAVGGGRRFFEIIDEKSTKLTEISPIFCNVKRFFEKIADISPSANFSPIFSEIFGYFFHRHFAPLFRFTDAWNTKFWWKKPTFSTMGIWYSLCLYNLHFYGFRCALICNGELLDYHK